MPSAWTASHFTARSASPNSIFVHIAHPKAKEKKPDKAQPLARCTRTTWQRTWQRPGTSNWMWTSKQKFGTTRIPFQVMNDVIDFVLDNTFISDLDNGTWRQIQGIPMGDPHSPGMTIGTCAWMEKEWCHGLQESAKHCFKAARYMDDILMFFAKRDDFDDKNFIRDFASSECYWKPLTLEDAKDATFLETSFNVGPNNEIRFWLKNDNSNGEHKVWRYAHYNSYMDTSLKERVLKATLQKLDSMASDDYVRFDSAMNKLYEFKALNYPPGMIAKVCNKIAVTTRNPTWFKIKNAMVSTTQIPAGLYSGG